MTDCRRKDSRHGSQEEEESEAEVAEAAEAAKAVAPGALKSLIKRAAVAAEVA